MRLLALDQDEGPGDDLGQDRGGHEAAPAGTVVAACEADRGVVHRGNRVGFDLESTPDAGDLGPPGLADFGPDHGARFDDDAAVDHDILGDLGADAVSQPDEVA
ncbi:MAG: hypothetical protein OXI49_13200 [Acidobacteriota bacterium]|nr:hypothetical protein [Acidobacteriota bacterium]